MRRYKEKLGFTGFSGRLELGVKLRIYKFQFEYIYCITIGQIFNLKF